MPARSVWCKFAKLLEGQVGRCGSDGGQPRRGRPEEMFFTPFRYHPRSFRPPSRGALPFDGCSERMNAESHESRR